MSYVSTTVFVPKIYFQTISSLWELDHIPKAPHIMVITMLQPGHRHITINIKICENPSLWYKVSYSESSLSSKSSPRKMAGIEGWAEVGLLKIGVFIKQHTWPNVYNYIIKWQHARQFGVKYKPWRRCCRDWLRRLRRWWRWWPPSWHPANRLRGQSQIGHIFYADLSQIYTQFVTDYICNTLVCCY